MMNPRKGAHAPGCESPVLGRLLDAASRDAELLAVILFGSAARGEQRPGSDRDVCLVTFPGSGTDPWEKRLDYLAQFDLDVQLFQQLPLYVRHRVLRDGCVLMCKDEPLLYQVAFRAVQAFEHFKPSYRRYLEAVSHGRP